jgi:hypothetical protein
MLVTQRNSAAISGGSTIFLEFSPPSSSAASTRSLGKNSSGAAPLQNAPSNFLLPASTLGGYPPTFLLEIAQGTAANPVNNLPVISSGTPESGSYSRRNLYVASGRLNTSSGYLQGQFVLNTDFFVNGQPPSTNPDSTVGLFPVNGQYFLNSQYRPALNAQPQNSGIPNQQFAINSADPISQQYNYNPVLAIQGNVASPNPALITGFEFRGGQYIADLTIRQNAIANLQPLELQSSQPFDNQGGQILINGQNIFYGKFSTIIGNQSYPTVQNGTVLLQGSYDNQGDYVVGTQSLANGQNFIPGFVANNGHLTSVQLHIEGAYTSGGQFVIYNTLPHAPTSAFPATTAPPPYNQGQSAASVVREQMNNTLNSLEEMATYLQNIAGLINSAMNQSSSPTNNYPVLAGQYLSLHA